MNFTLGFWCGISSERVRWMKAQAPPPRSVQMSKYNFLIDQFSDQCHKMVLPL